MKRIVKVEPGQKFRSIGVTGMTTYAYEVEAVFRSNIDQHDYARLVDLVDRTHTKTIALSTVLDLRHFLPMPQEPDGEATPRRRGDPRNAPVRAAP
jgi:hypothetical protein